MLEIFQRSVHGVDIFIIGDVIAKIDLWRGIARCNPDRVDAEILQVTKSRIDAIEVSDSVAIAVGETARIQFIEHSVLPPLMASRVDVAPLGMGKRSGYADAYD